MRRVVASAIVIATAGTVAACGSGQTTISANNPPTVRHGAQLFSEHCSGCHNLDAVNARGGAYKVRDRERVDGPNFNVRKETSANVLYAIQNGGFSGAIMPQDIVTGSDATDIAQFLSKYSGSLKKPAVGPTP